MARTFRVFKANCVFSVEFVSFVLLIQHVEIMEHGHGNVYYDICVSGLTIITRLPISDMK